ncbi:MAG TPA: hypothetical protein VNA89_04925 [Gemmatimonadaceae bacterium]|nr:hypothetical protein [Gemmatimonadaceae bacterium]
MSTPRTTSRRLFHPLPSARRLVAALAVLGVSTTGACVSRTLDNQGLEPIASPLDSAAVGNMVVSPEARALGQRIVQFDNTGTAAERAARRKDADLRMTAACAGDYRTGAEGPAAANGVVGAGADGASRQQSPFWYIQFVCVRDSADAPARP